MHKCYNVYGVLIQNQNLLRKIWDYIDYHELDYNNAPYIDANSDLAKNIFPDIFTDYHQDVCIWPIYPNAETDGLAEPYDVIIGYGHEYFPNTSFNPPPELRGAMWYGWVI